LVGDIDIAGSLAMTPTSTTGTTATTNYAINLAGTLNGNLIVEPGGTVVSTGDGAVGIVTTGVVNGAIVNFGTIEAIGTSTPTSSSDNVDPEAAAAFGVGASVTGGIYNAGPTGASGDTTARASIIEEGTSPALIISAPEQGTTTAIRPSATTRFRVQPVGGEPQYGIINRGSITALRASIPTRGPPRRSAWKAVGRAPRRPVRTSTIMGGLYNSGSISASVSNTTSFTGGGPAFDWPDRRPIFDGSDDLQRRSADVEREIAGHDFGKRVRTVRRHSYAIEIAANGSVTTIDNNGVISATASTTTLTISNLRAEAIWTIRRRPGGTVPGRSQTINNTGSIIASATVLNNDSQIARAIDLQGSTQNVTAHEFGRGLHQTATSFSAVA
jgi:hypothetical protein